MKVSTLMKALALLPKDMDLEFIYLPHSHNEISLDLVKIEVGNEITPKNDLEGSLKGLWWLEESEHRCKIVFNS